MNAEKTDGLSAPATVPGFFIDPGLLPAREVLRAARIFYQNLSSKNTWRLCGRKRTKNKRIEQS